MTHVYGVPVAPDGTAVENPAFDVTPNRYVTAIITERGVARAPYMESLSEIGKVRLMMRRAVVLTALLFAATLALPANFPIAARPASRSPIPTTRTFTISRTIAAKCWSSTSCPPPARIACCSPPRSRR